MAQKLTANLHDGIFVQLLPLLELLALACSGKQLLRLLQLPVLNLLAQPLLLSPDPVQPTQDLATGVLQGDFQTDSGNLLVQ